MVKWAYILIGDDRTGKTTFQKELIHHIIGNPCQRLNTNQKFDIDIRIGTKNAKTISFMNRSFQEKLHEYQNMQTFFALHFKDADIAILSSHLCPPDIKDMIHELKSRYFNVCGAFFENSIAKNSVLNPQISSSSDWDERYIIENPKIENEEDYNNRLRKSAIEFMSHILEKI